MSLHLKNLTILWRNVIKNRCFAFVFDHERSRRTVKTTRVLGFNQRNRKRIGSEQGKIVFTFCKIVFGSPESWLSKLWMKELEERELGQQTAAVALDEVPLWQWYGLALHKWSTFQVRENRTRESDRRFPVCVRNCSLFREYNRQICCYIALRGSKEF